MQDGIRIDDNGGRELLLDQLMWMCCCLGERNPIASVHVQGAGGTEMC